MTQFVTDGAEVASPVLADGAAVYSENSERRSGTSKWLHSDALGSTRGITNSSQTATDSILYDAFGGTISRTGTTPSPFGFVGDVGYQSDPDSGLMLLGSRYFDMSTGRFISEDSEEDGDNWYIYANNCPTGYDDPEGEQARDRLGGKMGGGLDARGRPIPRDTRPDIVDEIKADVRRMRGGGETGRGSGGGDFRMPPPPSARAAVRRATLPVDGRIRYVPPKNWNPTQPLPIGPGGKGYIDRQGRIWIKGPNHHFPDESQPGTFGKEKLQFEWDVQPGTGPPFASGRTHLNVSPNGTIR